jgi:Ca-activated chloride channel family protein
MRLLRKMPRALGLTALAAFAVAGQMAAHAVGLEDVSRGSLLAKTDEFGRYEPMTQLDTDVVITVTGPIARTVVRQRFANPSSNWIEALYVFPLPETAAVDQLRMDLDGRVIEGLIKEKHEARALYEEAKADGVKAALVEQFRPNLFHTAIANIPPGGEIEVSIEYQQRLQWRDDQFSLRFPMAITPRYTPHHERQPTHLLKASQTITGGWELLPGEAPNLIKTVAESIAPDEPQNRTSLRVILQPGFPVGLLESRYHQVQRALEGERTIVTLAGGAAPSDRDFVLEWSNADSQHPTAAFFLEEFGGLAEAGDQDTDGYGLLMVMPPKVPQGERVPREVTFIIDTSGSMAGESIRQATDALLVGLSGLKPEDSFNIVEFNSDATRLFPEPVAARPDALRIAARFVGNLDAGGGTEILGAFQSTLASRNGQPQGLQQIIFLTDGSVGNEAEIFSYIHTELGEHRLFMVGIGSGPNSHFMREAAHFGRGTFTYIADPTEVQAQMQALFAKLEQPVLTHLKLEADGLSDVLPAHLPDLYSGEPIVVAMRMGSGSRSVRLTGRLGSTVWLQDLFLEHGSPKAGLGVNWAREKIHEWVRAGIRGTDTDLIRQEVTALALTHHLVSPFTSLVALDVEPARFMEDQLQSHAVKGNRVAGMPAQNGQSLPFAKGGTGFELKLIVGGLLLLGAGIWRQCSRPQRSRPQRSRLQRSRREKRSADEGDGLC